ncbi:MAG: Rab family GTPase, partial [Waterburya sp.]
TSLIRRFVEDKFSDQYLSTIGVKVSRKSIDIETDLDTNQVNLLVWDLEGQTKFKAITPSYLKGASGAIVVADLTRSNSLNNLSQHINLFLEINPESAIAIALNKADLVSEEKLDKLMELYSSFSYKQVIKTYKTSAKTGEGVVDLFQELAMNIYH